MRVITRVLTILLKLAMKIILLPVILALTLIQLAGTVVVGLSSWVFDLLGGLFIVVGILSYAFGWDPASEMWRLLAIGAGFCAVPILAQWLLVKITVLTVHVKYWISC